MRNKYINLKLGARYEEEKKLRRKERRQEEQQITLNIFQNIGSLIVF